MIVYKTNLSIPDLLKEAEGMKYWLDGAGVYMSITQSGGIPVLIDTLAWAACVEIADYRKKRPLHLMINNLPAHTIVPIHSDPVLGRAGKKAMPGDVERWHLPIKTNSETYWWDECDGTLQMLEGIWYGPMPFWMNHRVSNDGSTNRIHLIVDLE